MLFDPVGSSCYHHFFVNVRWFVMKKEAKKEPFFYERFSSCSLKETRLKMLPVQKREMSYNKLPKAT